MASSNGYYSKFYSTFSRFRKRSVWSDSGRVLLGINVIQLFENPDAIDRDLRTVKQADEIQNTGKHRLKLMFSYDEYGNLSPELSMVVQGCMLGVFTGSIIGGTIHSKESFVTFIERNQGTAFRSNFEAQKELQNKVTLGFGRGAWMWGWRIGLFTGSFVFFTSTISVYRGKSSILEYFAAGGITGTAYKLKQGPRAMVAGGIIGAALGSIAGCINLSLMYLTGTSMEKIRYWRYEWKEKYQAEKLEELRKARVAELNSLTKAHEERTNTEEMASNTQDLLKGIDDKEEINTK
ncbi:RPII140-upstream gene protein [Procambarus clarkii]|uniref:RPII140-upstream gene protein n=1 Tax=Procambarus clarkii TaxID=6728 RepID=UPI001E676585|nr:RPII140-upstream gene protein-like [Procambarus clarkii]